MIPDGLSNGLSNIASKKFGVVLLSIWGIYQIGLKYESMAARSLWMIFTFAGVFIFYQALVDYRRKD